MKRLALLLLPLGLWSAAAEDEPVFKKVLGTFAPSVEKFANGYIDWGNGCYYTVSKGYPPRKKRSRLKRRKTNPALLKAKARQAAVEGAKAQILLMANNIRVDADATIGDLKAAGYVIKVEGDIKKYTIVAEGWVDDPERPFYEVVVKAPLSSVSSQLVDSQITKVRTGKRGKVVPPAEKKPAEAGEKKEEKPAPPAEKEKREEKREKTKEEKIKDIKKRAAEAEKEMILLIDARGTGAKQALFPEVKDKDGAAVFNITLPDKVKLKHEQMVKYVETDKSREELLNMLRPHADVLFVSALKPVETVVLIPRYSVVLTADTGEKKPVRRRRRRFFCTATSSAGKLKANIIISKKDAERIIKADKTAHFFKKANVYVLVDPSIGGTEGCVPEGEGNVLADLI